MELDDFKTKWKEVATLGRTAIAKEDLQKMVSALSRSGRGIRLIFILELIFVVGAYSAFGLLVFFFEAKLQPYMYKLVGLTFIATLPICYRLFKSQQWINSIDYSTDIKTNLSAFLRYYKTTLKLYRWSAYFMIPLMIIVLYADTSFRQQGIALNTTIVIYIVVVLMLTGPYVRWAYGRRADSIEAFLKDSAS